jgi:hypothetical protein
MATNKPAQGFYAALVAIIASAATASTGVFLLFGSFLENLVPPYQDSKMAVSFATFGTAIALLVLSLLIQKRLTTTSARVVSIICAVLLLTSIVLFGVHQDYTRTFVYRYPPSSLDKDTQERHVRGELHEKGQSYVGDKSVAQAVFELGGPDYVNSKGLLWSEASRLRVMSRMEMQYIVLAMLLTSSIFSAGIAVWRLGAK